MRRARAAWDAVREGQDTGSAVVEFLAATVIMLVPLVYLVLTIARLEEATYLAMGTARDAARVYADGVEDPDAAWWRATSAVDFQMAEHGFGEGDYTVQVDCWEGPCPQPGTDTWAAVSVEVALPWIPSFVEDVVPLAVRIDADALNVTDRFWEQPS